MNLTASCYKSYKNQRPKVSLSLIEIERNRNCSILMLDIFIYTTMIGDCGLTDRIFLSIIQQQQGIKRICLQLESARAKGYTRRMQKNTSQDGLYIFIYKDFHLTLHSSLSQSVWALFSFFISFGEVFQNTKSFSKTRRLFPIKVDF